MMRSCNDIIKFGESKSFSSLRPNLLGRHADDAFSEVPYEKGFNFLFYLEGLVNSQTDFDLFRKILRQYFKKFEYKSLKYEEFRDFFIETINNELGDKAKEVLDKIDWVQWIDAPGYPPVQNNFSNI